MMLRSFVAIEIPSQIQNAIANRTSSLQKSLPKPLVSWVIPQNIHLTLKFLGAISQENLERFEKLLQLETVSHKSFTMVVEGLGVFPSARRPRVIWIGIKAPPALIDLQGRIEMATAKLGYPPEERTFSPHLTIGRIGQNNTAVDMKNISLILKKTSARNFGIVTVNELSIFKSDLIPSGPIYTRLYALPLGN